MKWYFIECNKKFEITNSFCFGNKDHPNNKKLQQNFWYDSGIYGGLVLAKDEKEASERIKRQYEKRRYIRR